MVIRRYRPTDLPGLVAVWNAALANTPNFLRLTEADLRRRAVEVPSFGNTELLVAEQSGDILGFVHLGQGSTLWDNTAARGVDRAEGHIYALVAPERDRSLMEALLEAALARLAESGARRALLTPSWVQGTQPFYNGIAGAYEIPGLSPTRRNLVEVAEAMGFREACWYATPMLDAADQAHLDALFAEADRIGAQARRWGLGVQARTIESPFFPPRRLVEVVQGRRPVACAACGLWEEYARERGRRLFAITSVQVTPAWRRRGLAKLACIRALQAGLQEGAEGFHLHVYRDNQAAWNLYHQALGFRPAQLWVTLSRPLP